MLLQTRLEARGIEHPVTPAGGIVGHVAAQAEEILGRISHPVPV